MNATKTQQVISDLVKHAREYHRTGNITLRDQTIRSIEDAAPTRASAKREIESVYADHQ